LRPQILVALGSHAAQYLCHSDLSIGRLRGRWYDYHGVALYVTYHPAFLLRSPSQKAESWKDFQAIHARYTELNPEDPRNIWHK
jgi:uracil-DNA glycosylase